MEYEHLSKAEKALIVALSLLVDIPSLVVLAFSPAHAQTEEMSSKLKMGLMYHRPASEQEQEYWLKFSDAMTTLGASKAPRPDKKPIYATLVNASNAAKAGDYEGAMALIAAADRAIKKLP